MRGDKVRKTIAWIEDDIDELKPIMEPLEEDGFVFKSFRTYQQAIDGIDVLRKCDLIILDLILPPGKNVDGDDHLGIELFKLLREKYRLTTPILIFSVVAHASDLLTEEDLKKYDVRALAKPIRQERLMKDVYELVGLRPDEGGAI